MKTSLLRIKILGPIRAWQGPVPVVLGPRKQRAIFALLALRANQPVPVEDIMLAVWGPEPPASTASLVHTYVARLRRALEPEKPRRRRTDAISSTSAGYCLHVDPGRVDLLQFRQLVAQYGRLLNAGDAQSAFDMLDEALRLWRHDTSIELSAILSLEDELADLHLEWIAAALQYVTLGLALGQAATVQSVAERAARAEPMHELVQARYLVVLARTGQRSAAVAWYADLRRRLRLELGVDPSPELERAYRTVLGEDIVTDPPALAEAPAAHAPWRGPRPAVGDLIGRDEDLARLRELATAHRLITLTGPVGSGKSALALSLGHALHEEQPGGVAVVELWNARDEPDVVAGLDAVLDVSEPGLPPLLAALGQRQIFLILDDIDRVVDGCAGVVDAVVRSCPYVTVVVTSRETLGLPYEVVWQVGPLPVPSRADGGRLDRVLASPAVRLFAQRAAQVRPGFRVTAANARAVAATCRRLDGLPLALEFASICLRTHDLDEVATDATDSLRRLNPRRRGQPAHHRSLQDALRWAYDCLDPAEQRCLSALGEVGTEFSVEAAARACRHPAAPVPPDEVRRLLDGLAEKSFLQVHHRRDGTRYRILESVRAFASHRATHGAMRNSA